jgi:hypothetical protein
MSTEAVTTKLLKKLPLFKELKNSKKILTKQVRSLEYSVKYLESKNAKLVKKISKSKNVSLYKKYSKSPNSVYIKEEPIDYDHNIVYHVEDDESVVSGGTNDKKELQEEPEQILEIQDKRVVSSIEECNEMQVETIVEDKVEEKEEEEEEVEEKEEEVEEKEKEEDEKEKEKEEEVEEKEEKEKEEEEVVAENNDMQIETINIVKAEEEEEEAEEEEEEEAEAEEEEEEEAEAEEEEEEEEDSIEMQVEEATEEEEVYQIEINGKSYYVQNTTNSIIYEEDETGDISKEVGVYKAGKPHFY